MIWGPIKEIPILTSIKSPGGVSIYNSKCHSSLTSSATHFPHLQLGQLYRHPVDKGWQFFQFHKYIILYTVMLTKETSKCRTSLGVGDKRRSPALMESECESTNQSKYEFCLLFTFHVPGQWLSPVSPTICHGQLLQTLFTALPTIRAEIRTLG